MEQPRALRLSPAIVIGIALVDLGAFGFLATYEPEVMVSVLSLGLVFQIGGYRAVVTRGRTCAYWCGFLAVALAFATSFVAGGILPGSWFGRVWLVYLDAADAAFESLDGPLFQRLCKSVRGYSLYADIVCVLPQMIGSWIGGYALRPIAERVDLRRPRFFLGERRGGGRFSLSMMMLLIAVVAINMFAARRLLVRGSEVMATIGLACLSLQYGVFLAIREKGSLRLFWLAFLAGGLLALASTLPPLWRVPAGHVVATAPTSYLFIEDQPGSMAFRMWWAYWGFANSWLGRLRVYAGVRVIAAVLPQFLFSLTCGLAAWFVCECRAQWTKRAHARPANG